MSRRVAGVVEHAAGVLQQHSYRDPPVQPELGQVTGHRVVQPDLALGHQLQHHGCDEGLGDAAHPEMPVRRRLRARAELAPPGAGGPLAPLIVHAHLHTEETGIEERLDGLLQLRAILPGGGLRYGRAAVRRGHRRGRGGGGHSGQQRGGQRRDRHRPEDGVPAPRCAIVTAHRPDRCCGEAVVAVFHHECPCLKQCWRSWAAASGSGGAGVRSTVAGGARCRWSAACAPGPGRGRHRSADGTPRSSYLVSLTTGTK